MEYDIVSSHNVIQYFKKGTRTFHREDGPAIKYADGRKEWYINGYLHRIDGPAIETNERKSWWIYGQLHRLEGPAIEYTNGYKEWRLYGALHRENGPAVEMPSVGWWINEWWINGNRLSPEKEEILNKWWKNKNGI